MTLDASWVDIGAALILLLSIVLGLLRGLVHEVLSVLGWLVAWLLARSAALPVGDWLGWAPPGSSLRVGIGFVLTFALAMLAWRILAWLLSQIIKASVLAPIDRVLGGLFGLLRGGLIVVLLVTLAGFTPLVRKPFWRESVSVGAAQAVLVALAPILPGDWTKPSNGRPMP
ncbi:CvpA family protein [Leptothrix discophora]|uniref:CvpA family protein n=1 Tax=Leptothrix discophora TaxID=89 RepID=A0ABT9G561_LEPDI|nr:CvpA family protein [Leptothrix discophora]MDP4301633.1 CvpA family protein [Leptothrix discophora]